MLTGYVAAEYKPSSGEALAQLTIQWFNHFDPYWEENLIVPGLDTFPFEIKMGPAVHKTEYNLLKGGCPQFLWNCFGNWREFIGIARQGYLLFNVQLSSVPLAALDLLYQSCELAEDEC